MNKCCFCGGTTYSDNGACWSCTKNIPEEEQ